MFSVLTPVRPFYLPIPLPDRFLLYRFMLLFCNAVAEKAIHYPTERILRRRQREILVLDLANTLYASQLSCQIDLLAKVGSAIGQIAPDGFIIDLSLLRL